MITATRGYVYVGSMSIEIGNITREVISNENRKKTAEISDKMTSNGYFGRVDKYATNGNDTAIKRDPTINSGAI